MADHDVIASPVPQLKHNKNYGRKTVAELKTTLQTANAGYYTNARILSMTYNDLVFAVRSLP